VPAAASALKRWVIGAESLGNPPHSGPALLPTHRCRVNGRRRAELSAVFGRIFLERSMPPHEIKTILAQLREQGRAINAAAAAMSRDLSDDEVAKLEELAGQIEAREQELRQAEAAAAQRQRLAAAFAEAEPASTQQPHTPPAAATPVITQQHERSEDDPRAGFRTGQEFMRAVLRNGQGLAADARLAPLAAVGADEQRGNSDPAGGFLVPTAFAPNLLETGFEGDPTADYTMRMPMESASVTLQARTDKDHRTSVSGGFRVYRGSQASNHQSSVGAFEQITLKANPLTGLAYATDDLIQDSPISIAAIIEAGFRSEMGAKILAEKIHGSGVGEYEGILTSPALVTVAKESAQTDSTIVGKNIAKMRARCWGYDNAIWIANHDTIPQLLGAHIAGTNGDVAIFAPSMQQDVPNILLGRPIFFTEYASALGQTGDLICVNFSEYLEGNYQPIIGSSSIHVRFEASEQAFKFRARNDGRGWWRSPITPHKSAATLSPFVTLAARAS
jgi:HK97 family phage major capsid protein